MQSPSNTTRGSILQYTNSSPIARPWITRNIWIRRVHRSLLSRAARVYFQSERWREKGRSLTASECAGRISRFLLCLLLLFFFYQTRETTCRFTPAIMFARLRTGTRQAQTLIRSRAICRESSSRTHVPRNARCRGGFYDDGKET